ncbi:hypothetical protein PENTCL1PPCAC_8652, partial [Pristionchus entomophagus]
KIRAARLRITSNFLGRFDVIVVCREVPFAMVLDRNTPCRGQCEICTNLRATYSRGDSILALHQAFKLVSFLQRRYAFEGIHIEMLVLFI